MRSDNGHEFRSHVVQEWVKDNGIDWQFTQSGRPAENAYIERFNRTFRVEVLDAYQFQTLDHARGTVSDSLSQVSSVRCIANSVLS